MILPSTTAISDSLPLVCAIARWRQPECVVAMTQR